MNATTDTAPVRSARDARPGVDRGVPVGPVRDHVQAVLASGADAAWVARQAGVSVKTVRCVCRGDRPSVYGPTAIKLMGVRKRARSHDRLPAGLLREYVADLRDAGWSVEAIARVAEVTPTLLTPSRLDRVSRETEQRIVYAWKVLNGREGDATVRPYLWLVPLLEVGSLSELAAATGISRDTVHRARLGKPISNRTAQALAAWAVLYRHEVNVLREEGWLDAAA